MENKDKEKGMNRILHLFHDNIHVSEVELTEAYKYIFENSDFLPFLNDAELAETVIYLREEKENNQLIDIIALEKYFKNIKEGYASFIENCMVDIELEEAEKNDVRLSVGTNIMDDLLYYDYRDDKWKLDVNDIFQQILGQPWMSGVDIVKSAVLKTFEGSNKWLNQSNWDAKVIVMGHKGAGKSAAICKFQYKASAEVMVNGIVTNQEPGGLQFFDFGGGDLYENNYQMFYCSKALMGYVWSMEKDDVRLPESDDSDLQGRTIESSGMSLNFVDEYNWRPKQYNLFFLNACYSVSLDIDILNITGKSVIDKAKGFIDPIKNKVRKKKLDNSYSKKTIEYVRTLIQHLQPMVNENWVDSPARTDR